MLRHLLRKPVIDHAALTMNSMPALAMVGPRKGRMFSVQASLPRLPVPPLNQTLDRYLKTIQPLVTPEELEYTKKVTEEFRNHPGPVLQQFLEARAAKTNNWLSEWWKHVAYLDFRASVVLNSNPAVIFPKQNYSGIQEQLRFAAKLVSGALNYKKGIDNQSIPIETLGGKPLCMSQYYKIMSACRIPGAKIDTHYCYTPGSSKPPRHINVIHNNQIFSLDVYGEDGGILTVDQLFDQLMNIVNESQTVAPPVGMLCVLDRKSWHQAYKKIVKDKNNESIMRTI
ncbi:carnitine O-acetyltransferase [Patella vulgata]|uniref:carnitine O-acetyltransferase n=1 Tax=Patella vulgata TaxID=6465 RepID=UPI0024A7DC25|nr:carnitine O-acetyltransferase [Patella vulgata]